MKKKPALLVASITIFVVAISLSVAVFAFNVDPLDILRSVAAVVVISGFLWFCVPQSSPHLFREEQRWAERYYPKDRQT